MIAIFAAAGAEAKERGMDLAAFRRTRQIRSGMLAFLEALLASPNRTATLDESCTNAESANRFVEGGKWRGSIVKNLAEMGLIRAITDDDGNRLVSLSIRPARHRGLIGVWRQSAADATIRQSMKHLEVWLAAHPADKPEQPLLFS
jgi:hypothetical protein